MRNAIRCSFILIGIAATQTLRAEEQPTGLFNGHMVSQSQTPAQVREAADAENKVTIVFADYFKDATMRVDYFHTANATCDEIAIDEIYINGIWAGNPKSPKS